MSSILELPEARARAVRWSVEDYEQYGEWLTDQGVLPKWSELIRGIIIEKDVEIAPARRSFQRDLRRFFKTASFGSHDFLGGSAATGGFRA